MRKWMILGVIALVGLAFWFGILDLRRDSAGLHLRVDSNKADRLREEATDKVRETSRKAMDIIRDQ